MNIALPGNYNFNENGSRAYVKNKNLFITPDVDFKKLMISLTFHQKGRKRCYYCNRKLRNATIDHVWPKNYGGITITNNLLPACSKCNSQKTNMNREEFLKWLKLPNSEKTKFLHDCTNSKKRRINNPIYKEGWDLPTEWVTYSEFTQIKPSRREVKLGGNYTKNLEFAKKRGKLLKPIVISKNFYLLEGNTSYVVAKTLGMDTVPVIQLSNVIVIEE